MGAQTTRFVRSLLQSRNYRTKRSRSPITVTMDLPSLPPVSLAVHRRSFPFCPSQTVSIVSWRQSQIQTPERLYSKKGRGSKKRRERERDLLARLGLNVNCFALQQLCFKLPPTFSSSPSSFSLSLEKRTCKISRLIHLLHNLAS